MVNYFLPIQTVEGSQSILENNRTLEAVKLKPCGMKKKKTFKKAASSKTFFYFQEQWVVQDPQRLSLTWHAGSES